MIIPCNVRNNTNMQNYLGASNNSGDKPEKMGLDRKTLSAENYDRELLKDWVSK